MDVTSTKLNLTVAQDDKLCTQNSGIYVPREDEKTLFLGKLLTVVQLLYTNHKEVMLFKCHWYDTNLDKPNSVVEDINLLSISMNIGDLKVIPISSPIRQN